MLLLLIVMSYGLGSIASGVLVAKAMRLPDPRQIGSRNPGATNVLRTGSRAGAALTLIGDMLKAILPIFIAREFGYEASALAWVALAAFLGHLYPIFFRFRGGKGVATLLGALLALAWPLAIGAMITWLVTACLTRYSSLAALVAAVLTPVYGIWFAPTGTWWLITLMCLLLIARHHANIQRLRAGTETRIGNKDKPVHGQDPKK